MRVHPTAPFLQRDTYRNLLILDPWLGDFPKVLGSSSKQLLAGSIRIEPVVLDIRRKLLYPKLQVYKLEINFAARYPNMQSP